MNVSDIKTLCNEIDKLQIGDKDTIDDLCLEMERIDINGVVKYTASELLKIEQHRKEFWEIIRKNFPIFKQKVKNTILEGWTVYQTDPHSPFKNFFPRWCESF